MNINITLGQYYPAKSPIHSLDPRMKVSLTVLFMVAIFVIRNFWGYAVVAAFILVVNRLAKVPLSFLLKGLKPLRFVLILTFILNLFLSVGNNVLWSWWIFTITEDGLVNALHFSLRLVFLVMGTSLLTLTTTPVTMTDALERLLSPLRKIHFPAHELAMMMTIALRFIPTLLEETQKIMKAQKARGADFEHGNLMERAKALVPLLVPLFVSAFRCATDLANAMEARCYHGGENRTRYHVMKLCKTDFYALAITAAMLAAIILLNAI
ncbi:MAG: energy-coupling factor transporter transmembrane component T [Eubacteriales bacterium]|nr:energy-coupling factor transporter transmembrane component T [Eubacteriales bacterium]MDD3881558.1 energy-coupling factor transporter transmembrane component T [Eubacteriales bacterium]MDD4513372.1 energy-coupling factor transporter transmembrane component T [Eubacteriales bacterium]